MGNDIIEVLNEVKAGVDYEKRGQTNNRWYSYII